MNEGDYIVFGKWLGDAYVEYVGYFRKFRWGNKIDLTASDGQGGYTNEYSVRVDQDADEGQDYYRELSPEELTDQKPLQAQPVWVSYAREERNSKIYRGLILSQPETFSLEGNMRTVFYDTNRNRDRVRTLVPQAQALPCDSFWASEEPQPVYCPEDDDD